MTYELHRTKRGREMRGLKMIDFEFQPTLENGIVQLRPLVDGDWSELFSAVADPLIWTLHPARDRWRESAFRPYFAQAIADRKTLVAVDPSSGRIIGSSRFSLTYCEPDEVEIGSTFLVRAKWGGPVNRALKSLMVGHALKSFRRVIFLVADGNMRSRRAMEKIGAKLTDRSNMVEIEGNMVGHWVYEVENTLS